jgi:hypothetical protein
VEAVSLISVALSSIIALAAIGAGVWQQRQLLNHERETADRASVRSTLAETAAILHRAGYAIDEVNAALMGHAATMFDPAHPERAESVKGLERVGRELDRAIGLLRVQLGPDSSTTAALEEAATALLKGFRATRRIRFRSPPNLRIEDVNDVLMEEVEKAREEFNGAVASFVKRAHAAAGAQQLEREASPSAEQ